jgi:hypothetical protein
MCKHENVEYENEKHLLLSFTGRKLKIRNTKCEAAYY